MHSVQLDEDYRMEDMPEKRSLNYLIKKYRRSGETGKVLLVLTPRVQRTLSLREWVRVLVRRTSQEN